MLTDYNCLRDLNLDRNPNIQENYHLLCKSAGNLHYLSLQLCKITDEGVKKIADELQYADPPNEPKLLALNLSNNRIGDRGAEEIARMLRTNRSLRSLILTGNRICDDGAILIIQELNMSKLTHSEIVDLRRRRYDALILRDNKFNDTMSEKNSIIEIDHPFGKESVAREGVVRTSGNFLLKHLNLSFNHLSGKIIKKFIDCLRYQTYVMMSDTSRGLLYVRIEGNEFTREDDKDLIELEELLRSRQAGEYLSKSDDTEDSIPLDNNNDL
ncbi:hypothetical protein M0804_003385 [Polistes exclamans]|nr:hypothetical protein M0804_003385 [Polistes exclamans]